MARHDPGRDGAGTPLHYADGTSCPRHYEISIHIKSLFTFSYQKIPSVLLLDSRSVQLLCSTASILICGDPTVRVSSRLRDTEMTMSGNALRERLLLYPPVPGGRKRVID